MIQYDSHRTILLQ